MLILGSNQLMAVGRTASFAVSPADGSVGVDAMPAAGHGPGNHDPLRNPCSFANAPAIAVLAGGAEGFAV
jgi:hypothetical protein